MMMKIERFFSEDGNFFIDVVQTNTGYELHQYERRYDCEEEIFYEFRIFPGPVGKYGDFECAAYEAQRLLQDKN